MEGGRKGGKDQEKEDKKLKATFSFLYLKMIKVYVNDQSSNYILSFIFRLESYFDLKFLFK